MPAMLNNIPACGIRSVIVSASTIAINATVTIGITSRFTNTEYVGNALKYTSDTGVIPICAESETASAEAIGFGRKR